MRHAAYAGSFDPITNGHLAIIRAAAPLFDRLTVVIAVNPEKKGRIPREYRAELVKAAVKDLPNVTVEEVSQRLIAQWAAERNIQFLVRGLRSASDLEYERTIERANRLIAPSVQTIYIPAPPDVDAVSSSLVMGLIGNFGWMVPVRKLVPPPVYQYLRNKYLLDALKDAPYWGRVLTSLPTPIAEAYSSPSRHYHNLDHVAEVVELLNHYAPIDSGYLPSVAISAAFLHDIVIGREDGQDEEESARVAASWFEDDDREYARQVADTIRATRRAGAELDSLDPNLAVTAKYLVDADLGVLGRDPQGYREYAQQIRQEYARYSDAVFKEGRAKFLRDMLSRERIYRTPEFYEAFEARARVNMTQELQTLEGTACENDT